MASTSSHGHSSVFHSTVARAKTLLNRDLVNILKSEKLPSHGVKTVMQTRIIERLSSYEASGQAFLFDRLRNSIYDPTNISSAPHIKTLSTPSTPTAGIATFAQSSASSYAPQLGNIKFKSSPFYTILEPLTMRVECPAIPNHRQTSSTTLQFQAVTLDKLSRDKLLRVMLFCTADSTRNHAQEYDVAFPDKVDVKINEEDVRANMRGLKKKAGSTRPVDITDYLRKKDRYPNHIRMTYAQTNQKFRFIIYLVQTYTVESIVALLERGKSISKERVVNEMLNKSRDADVEAISTIMSLKCPLSTIRIRLPVRSYLCQHNQCFDASSFLQLQEQGPTWACPVCNKDALFNQLMVDDYVKNILASTASNVEQVTVEPNGIWSVKQEPDQIGPATERKRSYEDDADEEDVIEISDGPNLPYRSFTHESPAMPRWLQSVTPSSATSSHHSQSSKKRPASAVIDLTLSDEDEVPQPPRKVSHRPSVPTLNGPTDWSRTGPEAAAMEAVRREHDNEYRGF